MNENIPNGIPELCTAIEAAVRHPIQSPKDFRNLSEEIFTRIREVISPSTLMRIWGYVDSDVTPRTGTLTLLARFVGFRDWKEFQGANLKNRQSSVVVCRHLNVSTDIRRGQRIRLRWQPDRVCDIVYTGNLYFRVIRSENTGLKKDTTFMCPMIIEGEPLFLDNVVQYDIPASGYICGKRNGVTFNFIADEEP